jgi:hypothetical protein
VSTHLLDRLLADGHVVTRTHGDDVDCTQTHLGRHLQRVCILALCGIHLGPLRYLRSSTVVGPYLQYFESVAARELFEFQVRLAFFFALCMVHEVRFELQNTESQVSKEYVRALGNVLDHGVCSSLSLISCHSISHAISDQDSLYSLLK